MDGQSNDDYFAERLGERDHYIHAGRERGEYTISESNPNTFINAVVQRFAYRRCDRVTNRYRQRRSDGDNNWLSL